MLCDQAISRTMGASFLHKVEISKKELHPPKDRCGKTQGIFRIAYLLWSGAIAICFRDV
jgi:hypothetical protein